MSHTRGLACDTHTHWHVKHTHTWTHTHAMWSTAVYSQVGDGSHILFWRDRWLHGPSIADLAPRLAAHDPKRRANKWTVLEALMDQKWISYVQGALSVDVIVEFLELWDIISEVELQPGVEDSHIWRFSLCGQYTAKSAYDRFFSEGNKIWTIWEDLENLGTRQMPLLFVASRT